MKPTFKSLQVAAVSAFFLALLFVSCKKENQEPAPDDQEELDPGIEAVQSNAVAFTQFDDVFSITQSVTADDAGEDVSLGLISSFDGLTEGRPMGTDGGRCYTVNVVPKIRGEWPKTVTINFGDGCKGKDGKTRKGKIVSIFTKPAFLPGAVVSTTFINYQVDSFSIEGTHKVTNTSNGNKLSFQIEVINGKITNNNSGFWVKHESKREYTQLDGSIIGQNPFPHGYRITGWTKGSNSNDKTWRTEIVNPLVKKFDCKWISKGKMKIWWSNNDVAATLDFGNGDCDNKAILTYKDKSKEITL